MSYLCGIAEMGAMYRILSVCAINDLGLITVILFARNVTNQLRPENMFYAHFFAYTANKLTSFKTLK